MKARLFPRWGAWSISRQEIKGTSSLSETPEQGIKIR